MDTTQVTEGTQHRDNQITTNPKQKGSFARGRPKLVRKRQSFGSLTGSTDTLGPLTVITDNMTDTDIDRVIEDARNADKEFSIKDTNGKVNQYYKKSFTEGKRVTEGEKIRSRNLRFRTD